MITNIIIIILIILIFMMDREIGKLRQETWHNKVAIQTAKLVKKEEEEDD